MQAIPLDPWGRPYRYLVRISIWVGAWVMLIGSSVHAYRKALRMLLD